MTLIVDWVWQGLLLTALSALVLHARPGLSATTRHAVWWATLTAVLTLPLLHPEGPWAGRGLAHAHAQTNPVATHALSPVQLPATPPWLATSLLGAWLGSALLGSWRLVRARDAIERLRAQSWPMPEPQQRRLPLWRRVRHSGRRTALRITEAPVGACAIGPGNPAILISGALVRGLDLPALDRLIVHEHAHVVRYDDRTRLLQALVELLAWWHPAVRIISRQIDLEREAACDDHVVALTGQPRRYALALADAAALISLAPSSSLPSLVSGATRGGTALRQRVQRLLDPGRRHHPALASGAAFTWLLVLAASLAAAPYAPSPVTFVDTVESVRVPTPPLRPAEATPPSGRGPAPMPSNRLVVARSSNPMAPVPRHTGGSSGTMTQRVEPARLAAADERIVARALPEDRTNAAALAADDTPATQAFAPMDVAPHPVPHAWSSAPDAMQPATAGSSTDTGRGSHALPAAGGAVGHAMTDAAVTLGRGGRTTGTALASFFKRTGRQVAASF